MSADRRFGKTLAKRLFAVGAAFLAIGLAFLSAGFFVRGREYARFPDGGIYFAAADSYYAYADRTQNPLVTLTCFEVKKNGHKSFLSYENLVFADTEGGRYAPKDISVTYVFSDYYMSRLLVRAVLDITSFENGVRTLDRVYLTDGERETGFDVGSIRIAVYDKDEGSGGGRVSFSGYTSAAEKFSSYTVSAVNNGDKSVVFEELCLELSCGFEVKIYDDSGGVSDFEGFELPAGEWVYIRVEFFAGETELSFPFNYLKPALRFSSDGESRVLPVNAASEYLGRMDRADIQSYLKGRTGA